MNEITPYEAKNEATPPEVKGDLEIAQLLDAVRTLPDVLQDASTVEIADTFVGFNDLSKSMKKTDEAVKKIIKQRENEGMRDADGHVYLAGSGSKGIKIEKRVSEVMVEDAEEILETVGVLDYFPKTPNAEKMQAKLRELGVDPEEYCDPLVTVDEVARLYEEGVVNADTVKSIVTSKTSKAIKQHTFKTAS